MRKEDNLEILLFRSRYLKQKDYWSKKLSGVSDATDISFGSAGYDVVGMGAGEIEIPFPGELSTRLIKICKSSDLSIYIFLLSALKSLIFRYTFNQDSVVLSPVDRRKTTTSTLNSLLFIRDRVDGEMTFKDMVLKTRQSVMDAYENQDYPWDKLLDSLFPSFKGNESAPVIPNILCAMGSLHGGANIENIRHGLSFRFDRNGDTISGHVRYDAGTCKESEAARLSNHFVRLLAGAVENIDVKVTDISFITGQERSQLLVEFNSNKVHLCGDKILPRWFEKQVEKTPDAAAIGFEEHKITYGELNKRANRLAAFLRDQGLQANQLVSILMDRSPRMVESILGTWKAGGGYIPIDTNSPPDRIQYMLKDSQSPFLLTDSETVKEYFSTGLQELHTVKNEIIILDVLAGELCRRTGENLRDVIDPNDLSYIIFTSGSTGNPKGVLVEHVGMMNHIHAKIEGLQITAESIVAQNSPHTFDISVWQFFAALVQGGQVVIYSNAFVLDAGEFISRLNADGVTILEVVPSYLSAILEVMDMTYRSFDHLAYLLVTGEAIRPHLVKRWFEKCPGIKMVNAYGPTEASDDITHYIMDRSLDWEQVPIGKPLRNFNIDIVDDYRNLCPIGVKGEIWVSGAGVGRGYLNDREKTGRAFTVDLLRGGNIRQYKTGDMGRWLTDGNLEFFGRKDFQVKIRGFRIEPGEIEGCLLRHENINEAIVTVRENIQGDKYLCAYFVSPLTIAAGEMQDFLLKDLPGYMIPPHFVQLEKIPLTASGKVDRKTLPDPETKIGTDYVAPRSEIEKKLAEIWAGVLNVSAASIGIHDNFFDLGGHSLNATILAARVHKEMNVRLSLAEVFKAPEIIKLAGYIKESTKDKFVSIEPVEEKEYYPLSSAQKRLYILQQMDPGSSAYNVPLMVPLSRLVDIDKNRLEQTMPRLINRHESFRTSFEVLGEEPVQRIHKMEDIDFGIEYYDLTGGDPGAEPGTVAIETIFKNFVRPFYLSHAPLIRVGLIITADEEYILMMDMHHIISDLISGDILERDFFFLVMGKELPPLLIQYKDYAQWHNSAEIKESVKSQEKYWLREYNMGEIPLLNLPIDFARAGEIHFEGSFISTTVDGTLFSNLKKRARELDVSVMMLLFSVYKILLSRYGGQEEIIVGTVVPGRQHADLENIVGFFVNMLAIKTNPRKNKTFPVYLSEVKEKFLEAYENQEYQFEELVSKLDIPRQAGRHPLVDALFVFRDEGDNALKSKRDGIEGFNSTPFNISHFDLMLNVVDLNNSIRLGLEYSTNLFKTSTIEEFAAFYVAILEQVVEKPLIRLEDIKVDLDLSVSTSSIIQEGKDEWGL
jgi:amino acid adenylation domain-containing protein